MLHCTETRIAVQGVRSLVWKQDTLVDWVAGGRSCELNGDVVDRAVRYAYVFDAAVSLQDSGYAAIYTRGATKALILHNGAVQREINRSFYCADDYEYPIALFRLQSGREVLAHCPDDYCRLQIEDLATGEVLTESGARQPGDFFHSRVAASPHGRYLVSAGWVWHPMEQVNVYSVEEALRDPCHLDRTGIGVDAWSEESSAATFMADGRLAVALYDYESDDEPHPLDQLAELRLFDLQRPEEPTIVQTPGKLGTIVAVDTHHVLALYEHPRLIDLRSGEVVQCWPHIESGNQLSSIFGQSSVPAMAFDMAAKRYAFADASGITVLQFD